MAATLWRRAVIFRSPAQWANISRSVSVSASLQAKNQAAVDDTVKKVFVDKLKEYQKGSKGGKSVTATPESEKELQDELARLKRIYGDKDFSKFPKFEFTDKQEAAK